MKTSLSFFGTTFKNSEVHSSIYLAQNLVLAGFLISLFFNILNVFLDFLIYDSLFQWLNVIIGLTYLLYYTDYRYFAPHVTFLIVFLPTLYVNLDTTYSGTGVINYFIIDLMLSILIFKTNLQRISYLVLTVLAFIVVICVEVKSNSEIPVRDVLLPHIRFIIANIFLVFGAFRYTYLLENESAKKDKLIGVIQNQNNELETFSYMLSHDLKQPINNIASFASLINRKMLNEPYYEKYSEGLKFITKGGNEMKELVNDILTMSKVRQADIKTECVDLGEMLNLLVEKMSPYIQTQGGRVLISQMPNLNANGMYIDLVFQNLVENGLKYNKSKVPTIEISHLVREDNLVIRVVDNGFGISDDLQSVVFEPFKRGFANFEYEGTGLGLAICTSTVMKLGGEIELYKTGVDGTEFRIYFPVALLCE